MPYFFYIAWKNEKENKKKMTETNTAIPIVLLAWSSWILCDDFVVSDSYVP